MSVLVLIVSSYLLLYPFAIKIFPNFVQILMTAKISKLVLLVFKNVALRILF